MTPRQPAGPPAKTAPISIIRRLAIYHQLLLEMRALKVEVTSSTVIAERLGYVPIQVRKDLQITGIVGRPKIGFAVAELLDGIEAFLGWSREHRAVLFGVGNLGTALLNYPWLAEFGIRFQAAFENAPSRTNIIVNHTPIHAVEYFHRYMKRNTVDIAVIAVSPGAAQEVANLAVAEGITGLWNFSAVHLKVPPHVTVENALFTQSLAVLTRRLIEHTTAP